MSKNMNCAEAVDYMNRKTALAMGIVGLTYFVIAAEKLIEPGALNSALDSARLIGVGLTVLVTFLGFVPIIRMKVDGKFFLSGEPESFMTEALHKSFKNSWMITMVATVAALSFGEVIDSLNLDISFFLIVLFGFMTFTTSLSFFFITRNDDDLEE